MRRYGLDVVGYVEPKPGVPPSPSHTFELINLMKAQKVKNAVIVPDGSKLRSAPGFARWTPIPRTNARAP